MVCHSLLQWTTFCQISPPWPAHLGLPWAWLSFIELDKAVVLVWLDWLVFCEYGFSVSALWCRLATPTVLLAFLLPWGWGISSWLLQQNTAIAPYLGRGYLLTATLPDLQRGIAPLGPPAPAQPWLLGHEVGPPGHSPWLQAWGCSSWLLPLASGLRRRVTPQFTAPDLGRRVTPLFATPDLGRGTSRHKLLCIK